MENREGFDVTTPARAEMARNMHKADKAFDESMITLMNWLHEAKEAGYLTSEEVAGIFSEELKTRRGYDCIDS